MIIAIAAVVIFWGWRVTVNNPGLTGGEILLKKAFTEKVTFFLFIPILLNIGQAGLAASIHPDDQSYPTIVRFMVHGGLSAVAILCSLFSVGVHTVYTMERDKWLAKSSNNTKKNMPSNIKGMYQLFVMLLVGAIVFPLLNLWVIAGGMRQTQQLLYFFMPWHPYGGLTAWNSMLYIFQAELAATIGHFFMMGIDAMWIKVTPHSEINKALMRSLILTAEEAAKDSSSGKDPLQNKQNQKNEDARDNVEAGLEFILKRYGYKGAKLTKMLDTLNRKLDGMSKKDSIAVSVKVAKLKDDIVQSDKRNLSSADKRQKNFEFKRRIFKLCASSTNGEGFGTELKDADKYKEGN